MGGLENAAAMGTKAPLIWIRDNTGNQFLGMGTGRVGNES